MENWAQWMRSGGISLWYPSRASGGMGRSGASDFDAMCANADARCAAAVDALIEALPQNEKLAVHNVHTATVFKLRGSTRYLYGEAKIKIGKGLDARGIV